MRVLVTGGAGFVGSRLAGVLARAGRVVVAFDSLRREGSELNAAVLRDLGIELIRGDVRVSADLEALDGPFDVIVDASAEASVHAGARGAARYVVDTNLSGTVNCLELARARGATFLFLSTSRVYSIAPLRSLALDETETRFELSPVQRERGASARGIAEDFPMHLPRSLYGATKLASELLIQEYVETYGMRAVINRCGVIAGAGQFGRPEQGVVTLWVARHVFGQALTYTGFGGQGKQVRDVLHPDDLADLLERQLEAIDRCSGEVFNVGGGVAGSLSLRELTALCQQVTGSEVELGGVEETASVDIPVYISDNRKVTEWFGWSPARTPSDIVAEIAQWIQQNEESLRPILGGSGQRIQR